MRVAPELRHSVAKSAKFNDLMVFNLEEQIKLNERLLKSKMKNEPELIERMVRAIKIKFEV